MEIYNDLLRMFFWLSITYLVYILIVFFQKIYEFFVLKNEKTYFSLNKNNKILFWFTISYIITYLI